MSLKTAWHHRFALRCAVFLAGAIPAATLHAQTTINVGPGQTYTTIQAGINAANPGDTVSVAAGTYLENVDFNGKRITVISTAGAATTIIDGKGAGPVVSITGATTNGGQFSVDSSLIGFTIQNGGKPQSAGGPQGGIYIANASPEISSNIITKNFCAGIYAVNSNAGIYSNHINQTLTAGCAAQEGLGSGLAMNGSDSTVSYSTLIIGNVIELNTASVAFSADKGGGGAINITNATAVVGIVFNILRNNTTTGYGGAFYLATTPQLGFENNLVYGNKGTSGGLDIVIPGSSVGPLVGYIANNTIVGNNGTAANGGSDVYIGGNLAQYALINNVIVGYASKQITVDCGTTYANQTLTPLIFDHNDIYAISGSGSTPVGGACTAPPAQVGNISVDPQFVNGSAAAITAGTADFHLSKGSKAIDTGNNSAALAAGQDLDQNPRIQDGTGIGYPVVDMGAYEFNGTQDAPTTVITLTPSSYTPSTGSSITLTSVIDSSYQNQFTTPTGNISFSEDFVAVGSGVITAGTPPGTGSASFPLANLTAGLHHLTAVYAGQGSFSPATSIDVIINVTAATTTPTSTTLISSLNPSNLGQTVKFTATVAAQTGTTIPTGSINFTDGTTLLSNQPLDATGTAAYSTAALTAGSHTITATYIPTGNFSASSAQINPQIVNGYATKAVLTLAPTTANTGDPVTLSATITPKGVTTTLIPTGTVTFLYAGTTVIGTATLNTTGVANLITTTLPAGDDKITCTYSGDNTFAASACNTVGIKIIDTITTITLTSNRNPAYLGQTITFTLKTTSKGKVPLVPITLTANGALLATLTPTTETTKYKIAKLAVGTYDIVASFAGNGTQGPSSASLTQVVELRPSTVTLAVTPTKALLGAPITLAATTLGLKPTKHPGGKLTFYDGTTSLGVFTLTKGVATLTTSSLAVGTHNLTCSYGGNKNYAGSACNTVPVIVYAPATIAISASPTAVFLQNPVNLSASVTSSYALPTGTITFLDGSTPIATVNLSNGAAAITTSTLAFGTHSITASYSGDANFAPGISPIAVVVVEDFSLTIPNSPLTIPHGGTAVFNLQVAAVGAPGMASAITFSLTGNPDHSPVTFAPATIPTGSGSVSGTLTIAMPDYPVGPFSSLPAGHSHTRETALALIGLGALLLPFTRRRARSTLRRTSCVIVLLAASVFLTTSTGCSGGWGSQRYNITVTATSGQLSRSATATLISQ